MKFSWGKEKISFLSQASEFNDFNKTLALHIAPMLKDNSRVADVGCGLGYLSVELCKFADSVTAIDVSSEALEILKKNIARQKLGNICVVNEDIFKMSDEAVFDDMVFCFFTDIEQALPLVKKHVRHNAIFIKKDFAFHRFSLKKIPLSIETFTAAKAKLEELNIKYQNESLTLQMGQPFKNTDEAVAFFELNKRDGSAEQPDKDEVVSRLTEIDEKGYKYFLDAPCGIGIITVNAGDIPV